MQTLACSHCFFITRSTWSPGYLIRVVYNPSERLNTNLNSAGDCHRHTHETHGVGVAAGVRGKKINVNIFYFPCCRIQSTPWKYENDGIHLSIPFAGARNRHANKTKFYFVWIEMNRCCSVYIYSSSVSLRFGCCTRNELYSKFHVIYAPAEHYLCTLERNT